MSNEATAHRFTDARTRSSMVVSSCSLFGDRWNNGKDKHLHSRRSGQRRVFDKAASFADDSASEARYSPNEICECADTRGHVSSRTCVIQRSASFCTIRTRYWITTRESNPFRRVARFSSGSSSMWALLVAIEC